MRRFLYILPLLILCFYNGHAQSCFARVQLDRSNVYVQQPFKVTITVLTATWYTAPIEFDNLQVPNAFVLPFDRTLPGIFEHNGKQYAGIQFYFIVFPYKAGEFTLPAITVHATTPPEGSSESRRITIKTPVRKYTVERIPDDVVGRWLVAKSVSVFERWNKPLSNLKVGDVIERTVTVRARGTLPQFIPPLMEKDLDFANVYPQDPELKDTRNEYDANGELTQSFIYLLEKEGEFTLPAMKVQWWNPNAAKINARSLPEHPLRVKPNPDLGMVATIRDSLNVAQQSVTVAETNDGPRMIFGMPWYWFAALAVGTLLVLMILIRISMRIISSLRDNYQRYRSSETYWFRHAMRSPSGLPVFWRRFYEWWDHADQTNKTPDILETAAEYPDPGWEKTLQQANAEIYGEEKSRHLNSSMKRQLRSFRKWLKKRGDTVETKISDRQRGWDSNY